MQHKNEQRGDQKRSGDTIKIIRETASCASQRIFMTHALSSLPFTRKQEVKGSEKQDAPA